MGKEHFDDLGVAGKIILNCTFKKEDGSLYWIDLAQSMDKLFAVVNKVMNFRFPQNAVNYLTI
jgi:hypothetical protein